MPTTSERLVENLCYARALYRHWRRQGRLKEQDFTHLMSHLKALAETLDPSLRAELNVGAVRELDEFSPGREELEFARLQFVQVQNQAGISSSGATSCLHDWHARSEALEGDVADPPGGATPPPYTPAATKSAATPQVGWAQRLLDPRNLQILMMASGGLLVLGMVVWLWSVGVFENPLTVAFSLGGGNLALLAAGMALVQFTRHVMAGRAVTLLACLLMPLHLWYYDAQGLITISEGGHLWAPALVCCAIYAAVARWLKDPLFVYTLVGGISLTGLLILADENVSRLSEFAAPATLLVTIGLVCLHVERLFSIEEGPFSRERFGRAFFRAGQGVLVGGLGVLFVGRMLGVMSNIFPASFAQGLPDVASDMGAMLNALALTLAATYGYLYSQWSAGRRSGYLYGALATLLWSEWILLDLLSVEFTAAAVALVLAGNALVVHGITWWLNRRVDEQEDVARNLQALGTLLTSLAVVIGLGAWMLSRLMGEIAFEGGLVGIVTLVTTSLACLACGYVGRREQQHEGRPVFLEASLLPLAAAAVLLVEGIGLATSPVSLAAAMLVPATVALLSRLRFVDARLGLASAAAATLLLVVGLWDVMAVIPAMPSASLGWAALFGMGALVLGLWKPSGQQTLFAAAGTLLLASASAWQLLVLAGVGEYSAALAATLVGFAAWIAARMTSAGREEISQILLGWRDASGFTIVVGGLAGMLLAVNRVMGSEATWTLLPLLGGLAAVALVVAAFARDRARRVGMMAVAIGHVAAGLMVVSSLVDLTPFQRGEILVTASGIALLVAGHAGWRKERGVADPSVSTCLLFGSLMSIVPPMFELLMLRTGFQQSGWGWQFAHEAGGLGLALALLAAGLVCRIRATTMAGAGGLAFYILTLLTLVDLPDRLQSVAVYMMVGGGVLFTSAILLSIYRDRLLAIPGKVRSGEGVFCVLKWR